MTRRTRISHYGPPDLLAEEELPQTVSVGSENIEITPAPFIAGDEWQHLEDAGNIALDEAARSRIVAVINDYRASTTADTASPRASSVHQTLREFYKVWARATEALQHLVGPGARSNGAAMEIRKASIASQPPFGFRDLSSLAEQSDRLCQFVLDAIVATDGDVGRPNDENDHALIRNAFAIFRDAGGKGKTSKAALGFVSIVCQWSGRTFRSESALKLRVTEALNG